MRLARRACCALAAGLLRVGFVAPLLSSPVLIGYLAGVAVIMVAGQLGKLLGVQVDGTEPIAQIVSARQLSIRPMARRSPSVSL